MAAYSGRDLIIGRTGPTYTAIAAVSAKSVEINNSGVDITTDDSDGWQTMLAEPGVRAVNLSISGVADDTDEDLLDAIMLGTSSIVLEDLQIKFDGGGTGKTALTGDFQFSSLSFSGEKDGATGFEATLTSSGAIVQSTLS